MWLLWFKGTVQQSEKVGEFTFQRASYPVLLKGLCLVLEKKFRLNILRYSYTALQHMQNNKPEKDPSRGEHVLSTQAKYTMIMKISILW